jgi:hypothetical protein
MDEIAVAARTMAKRRDSSRAGDFEAFFRDHHEALFRALWLLTRNRRRRKKWFRMHSCVYWSGGIG